MIDALKTNTISADQVLTADRQYFVKEALDFCRVMLPRMKEPQKTLCWHIQNLGIVADRPKQTIQGLGLFRFINTPEQCDNHWLHVPGAPGLWVDWTASLENGGLSRMIQTVYSIYYRPKWIGFSRFKHKDRVSVYPVSFFDRLLKAGI
jgi:hypothetical protein